MQTLGYFEKNYTNSLKQQHTVRVGHTLYYTVYFTYYILYSVQCTIHASANFLWLDVYYAAWEWSVRI
jgi:hypothetical protein